MPAEPLILQLINIHHNHGSKESFCAESLFLKVDKMSAKKKIAIVLLRTSIVGNNSLGAHSAKIILCNLLLKKKQKL